MLLAVDIGNSEVTLGVHDGTRWIARWRLRSVVHATTDEYALWIKGLFREADIPLSRIQGVSLASVVPPLTDTLGEVLETHFDAPMLIVNAHTPMPIRIAIDKPEEVGADLIANAVAAYHRLRAAHIVVSLGTATVLTAVNARGEFLGAAIAPGLRMAAAILAERTAQLPGIQLQAPSAAIGRNTVQAMQSGLILGYVGLIEGLVARFREEMGTPAPVIATGGLAGLIAPHTLVIEQVDPWLTLEGLRLLAEYNHLLSGN